MQNLDDPNRSSNRIIVIGAGIAGLAAALRLSGFARDMGREVLVLDRHSAPGGKMRTVPSAAGPVDAGPTVLTMRHVFDDLFAQAGTRLEDHISLIPQSILARHWWPDGSSLDLHANPDASAAAIRNFAGPKAEKEFHAFNKRAAQLYRAFDAPMMQAPEPSLPAVTSHVMRNPSLISAMAPQSSLAEMLSRQLSDPRLAQLFGRYATYVGGSPYRSPAILALIWQAEAAGVWCVKGGMHNLARAIATLAAQRGVRFHYDAHVSRIEAQAGQVCAVHLQDGTRIAAETVLFNGDPRALATGAVGADVQDVAAPTRSAARSLSAQVWSFAAKPAGLDLVHHNVFFCKDPKAEFAALEAGQQPSDPTLYICAEDRGQDTATPPLERFEIIANAPPFQPPADCQTQHQDTDPMITPEDFSTCQTRTFQTLARFGLTFQTLPGPEALTTPEGFNRLFPASTGSLYGQSPHGMMAAFQRPTARTTIKGLYLAGGGTHPGAGVPMATLSARHAAAAIMSDLSSTSTSRQTGMRGGISTG
jgi:1-hydroxycarotenoid 3,4-desaturase